MFTSINAYYPSMLDTTEKTFHLKVTYFSEYSKTSSTLTTTATALTEEIAKDIIIEKLRFKFKASSITCELIAIT